MFDDQNVLSDLDQLRSRYELLGELGRDGASRVYRGRVGRSEREVAIKLMAARPASNPKPGARFGWQAHTAKPLHHPNLVALHAVHHLQGGALALAMEHGGAPTLAEVIRGSGPLPLERVEQVLRGVAGALAYLHGEGVVHRGVRPEGIFLDGSGGEPRLAHFAIEGVAEEAPVAAFAYLAPEQIEGTAQVDGAALGARSDVYSLGLVGYAMLAGRQPWAGSSLAEVAARRRDEPLPPLADLRSDAPVWLCHAIEGALQTNPARRWRSAEEFLSRLDPAAQLAAPGPGRSWPALAARVHERVGSLRVALPAHRFRGRRDALATFTALALAAVAAVGVLRAGAGSEPPASAAGPAAPPPSAPQQPERQERAVNATRLLPATPAASPAIAAMDTGPAADPPPPPERPIRARSPRPRDRVLLLGAPVETRVPPLLGVPVERERVSGKARQ